MEAMITTQQDEFYTLTSVQCVRCQIELSQWLKWSAALTGRYMYNNQTIFWDPIETERSEAEVTRSARHPRWEHDHCDRWIKTTWNRVYTLISVQCVHLDLSTVCTPWPQYSVHLDLCTVCTPLAGLVWLSWSQEERVRHQEQWGRKYQEVKNASDWLVPDNCPIAIGPFSNSFQVVHSAFEFK